MSRERCSIPGKLPVTGRDTVLDAINYCGRHDFRRPITTAWFFIANHERAGRSQAFHVDIDQIMMGDDLSTNYQLLPGDRLVVPRNASSKASDGDHGRAYGSTSREQQSSPVSRTSIVTPE